MKATELVNILVAIRLKNIRETNSGPLRRQTVCC